MNSTELKLTDFAIQRERFCAQCDKLFTVHFAHPLQKYCSLDCQRIKNSGKSAQQLFNQNLPTGTIGAISELFTCQDLLSKGFHVFKAVSATCPCDLVAMKDNKLYRVEVTTARRNSKNIIVHCKKSSKPKYDILACVILEENQVFYETSLNLGL